jgi:hypothetical protein
MSTERKVRRKVVNFKEADFETYSLQGKPQADLSWHNISLCLANSYYVHKSPLFHGLVNPGGNATIWVHA